MTSVQIYYIKMEMIQEPLAADDISNNVQVTSPSKVIKYHQTVLEVEGNSLRIDLVNMRRTFMVAINNENTPGGFRDCNTRLSGLSLSIGGMSTCLMNADTSESSNTLATRLSKKFNNNNPVYVANNFMPSRDIDMDNFMAKLYMRIFQFVGNSLAKDRISSSQTGDEATIQTKEVTS